MNSSAPSPSIFEKYNARALQPREVAKSFVPPNHFQTLSKDFHSVVVGPRGSGKTTLLKMLQQPALESWDHPDAEAYRERITYTGVFVPTDVNWKTQVEALTEKGFSEEHQKLFTRAVFTTHALHKLTSAMDFRVHPLPAPFSHRRVQMEQHDEARLVTQIATSWYLEPALPTLNALKHTLSDRLKTIRELVSREEGFGRDRRDERIAEIGYLHLPFLESMAPAIEAFNDIAQERDGKWALLFDELELAPTWLRSDLFRSIRSVDSRFLFKLSMSPYDSEFAPTTILSPMPKNDYDSIPLWYAHKEDGFPFCRTLWAKMLESRGIQVDQPEEVLGPSLFDTSRSDAKKLGTAYGPGTPPQIRFQNLAKSDKTFRDHLAACGIKADELHLVEGDARAADVRKITAIVAIREAFRTPDESKKGTPKQRVRSRKNPGLYYGAEAIFAMVEGNPRWLIAIGSQMLDNISKSNRVSKRVQTQEISKAAKRFDALLRTIPCTKPEPGKVPKGVLTLIEMIGKYIFESVVLDDFNADPVGSFTIDEGVSDDIVDSLGKALNAGAIVFVPGTSDEIILNDLRGRRFRLSYLLASSYKLPIRLGRAVSLSHIAKKPGRSSPDIRPLLFAVED